MTTRYFKATNGTITAFRASETRVYRSAHLPGRYGIGFSGTIPGADKGAYPAIEITKAEYEALQAAKLARVRRKHPDAAASWANSPQDSWVDNADLAPQAAA